MISAGPFPVLVLRGSRSGGTLRGVKGEALETMRARNDMDEISELYLSEGETADCESCGDEITNGQEGTLVGDDRCYHTWCIDSDRMDAAVSRYQDRMAAW